MKTPLIIHFTTSRSPLTRLRDGILLSLCWLMWTVVLMAVVNSTEWDLLQRAGQSWWLAQQGLIDALTHQASMPAQAWQATEHGAAAWWIAEQRFGDAVLNSVHLSSSYFGLVGSLMLGFSLWSLLNLALSSRRFVIDSAPLKLATLARHFELDATLVAAMQRQKTVVVHHASSGNVTALTTKPGAALPESDDILLAA
ncbi:MAG: PgaD family protein [Pseudomonadota bacterium]|nr:PgaD family protein [Pseudomonadota bacterium]